MSPICSITTIGGRQVNPFDMRPEDIDIRDIAHSLAMQCRYIGHVSDFASVAQHSVLCSMALDHDPELARYALLHDASEAYVGDVPKPIKDALGRVWYDLEEGVQRTVAKRFGLPWPMPEEIHRVDRAIRTNEHSAFRVGLPRCEDHPGIPDLVIRPIDWRAAREAFLLRWGAVQARCTA